MEVRGGAAQQVSVEERMREEQSYGKKGHVLRSRRKCSNPKYFLFR